MALYKMQEYMCPRFDKKVPSAEAEGTHICEENYFFRDSSTATATETVIPAIGLLPFLSQKVYSNSDRNHTEQYRRYQISLPDSIVIV